MDPNNIQRHQYNTNPDSSYGAVFQLDTLVDVIPGLIYPAWLEVCVLTIVPTFLAPTTSVMLFGLALPSWVGGAGDPVALQHFLWSPCE